MSDGAPACRSTSSHHAVFKAAPVHRRRCDQRGTRRAHATCVELSGIWTRDARDRRRSRCVVAGAAMAGRAISLHRFATKEKALVAETLDVDGTGCWGSTVALRAGRRSLVSASAYTVRLHARRARHEAVARASCARASTPRTRCSPFRWDLVRHGIAGGRSRRPGVVGWAGWLAAFDLAGPCRRRADFALWPGIQHGADDLPLGREPSVAAIQWRVPSVRRRIDRECRASGSS